MKSLISGFLILQFFVFVDSSFADTELPCEQKINKILEERGGAPKPLDSDMYELDGEQYKFYFGGKSIQYSHTGIIMEINRSRIAYNQAVEFHKSMCINRKDNPTDKADNQRAAEQCKGAEGRLKALENETVKAKVIACSRGTALESCKSNPVLKIDLATSEIIIPEVNRPNESKKPEVRLNSKNCEFTSPLHRQVGSSSGGGSAGGSSRGAQ